MAQRNIFILEKEEAPWRLFLEEFLADTSSLLHVFQDPIDAGQMLNKIRPDLLFINDSLLNSALAQKVAALRQTYSDVRVFKLLDINKPSLNTLPYDFVFEEPILFSEFQKKLVRNLPYPQAIKFLLVDDGVEIGDMFRDYLEAQSNPQFDFHYRDNGKKGIEAVEAINPDIIVMDVKMPEMTGIEAYRRLKQMGYKKPIIMFFDAIFGDEIMEIHKIGRPVIVEKGSHESTMQEMHALILKMYYFG